MLRELRVGNLALAADVAISFDAGLTMLTGETGAGKSLIAGALSLLAGGPADRGLIRKGEDLAFVEGVFDLGELADARAEATAAGLRVGQDGVLVLRRELRREGRGRVLINGLVSSLALLERIGGRLVAVQSQDQQRRLARPGFAVDFLDGALDLLGLRQELAEALETWRDLTARLAERRQEAAFALEQLEMWRYQLKELDEAGLDADEESALAEQIALGRNARALLEAAAGARQDLTEGEVNAAGLLGKAGARLDGVGAESPRLAELLGLVREAQAAADEAARGLERFLDGVEMDPSRLDEMEERKALYEELRRKYERDVSGLLELQDRLRRRVARQEAADDDLVSLTAECDAARDVVADRCLELRRRRLAGAAAVAARACDLIRPLALPELELSFAVEPSADAEGVAIDGQTCRVGSRGADRVTLTARTNRGEEAGEVARIASGGERSRIYLGLTVMGLGENERPVQLFDEIDAGLGMEGALPVAALLEELAGRGQVLCITHMPTVAARGRRHLLVAKGDDGARTTVRVQEVAGEARVLEIARLLGGEGAGDRQRQLAYAAELLAPGARRGRA